MMNLKELIGERGTAREIREKIEHRLSKISTFYGVAEDIKPGEFIWEGVTYYMENKNKTEIEFNFEVIDDYEGWNSTIEVINVTITE